jgi:hypothetical protein
MQHSFPTPLQGIWRESQRVAGGSKWTYEATFHIAMKGGREYYTTAAHLSIYPSIHLSIYPSIHLSIYPSIHLSIYPSILLSVFKDIVIVFVKNKICINNIYKNAKLNKNNI